jgi:hypothetical protein
VKEELEGGLYLILDSFYFLAIVGFLIEQSGVEILCSLFWPFVCSN